MSHFIRKFIKIFLKRPVEPFKLSEQEHQRMIDSFDSTVGWLVKDSELRYWIEHFVNEDRKRYPRRKGRVKQRNNVVLGDMAGGDIRKNKSDDCGDLHCRFYKPGAP